MRRLARLQSETVREVAEVSVTQATQAAARYWRATSPVEFRTPQTLFFYSYFANTRVK